METDEKIKDFKEKIEVIVKEFADGLRSSSLTGYSLFNVKINKDSNGFLMETDMGLKIILNGEEVSIGADISFERGGRSKEYAKMYIDFSVSKGRDFTIKYHDECSNTQNNSGSINGVKITDVLFSILYQMTDSIYKDSPMPMIG